jgi:hypothetical protein
MDAFFFRQADPDTKGEVMSRNLPERPNLEYLRKQAKDRLAAMQQQNNGVKLADALHEIARQYGFSSWPKLKAHVEGLRLASPLAGRWIAAAGIDAALQFEVHDEEVTITDEHSRNVLLADGRNHPVDHGYVLNAKWLSSRALETVINREDREVGRVKYEVSKDGATLTLSAIAAAHNGYPATEQLKEFRRV